MNLASSSVRAAAVAAALLGGAFSPLSAQSVTGETSSEMRAFANSPLYDGQKRHDASLVVAPEIYFALGRGGIVFEPFVRLDAADDRRTHFDVRTLAWEGAVGNWELTAGVARVFWGVTESQHLVDVINQTDLVENLDGEDKLGQPMIKVGRVTNLGVFEAFVLPGFRERTFPGSSGRIRTPLPVDVDRPLYQADSGGRHVDFAARWSHYLGAFDLGLSWFRGTQRDPRFLPEQSGTSLFIRPTYDLVEQFGMDAQWIRDTWILKFEGVTRRSDFAGRMWAMTAGFEYSIYQFLGTTADLGVISEILLDDRGLDATTPFEDDIFVGGRLAFNDVAGTELLLGGVIDRGSGSTFLNVEGSRRLTNYWTVDVQARAFLGVQDTDLLYALREDDHLMIAVRRFF